jgi:hypothetical protein
MGYEVFTRDQVRKGFPTVRLTGHGRITLSGPAADTAKEHNVEYVVLLWDKDAKRMALKKTNEADTRAYPVAFASRHGCALSAKAFLDYIGDEFINRTYLIDWNPKEEMFEADLKQEHKPEPTKRSSRRVKPKRP